MAIELSQEGIAHASSNDDLIGNIEHVQNELDLINDFGPS